MFSWIKNWLFGKADVNKDGQVNMADAKIVAEKAAVAAAPVVEKAAEAVAAKATKVATKAKAKGKAKVGTKK